MKTASSFSRKIESVEELRAILGEPSEVVQRKTIHYIDEHCRDFISKSSFVVLSTSDDQGFCDASPRGDSPGFVKILNEKTIIIPERPGNKRVDSMRNIVANPNVGLLFFIPGLGETLRINGKAVLIQDEEILKEMAVKGKVPMIGIAVEADECYVHCAKAFMRSGLWQPDSWMDRDELPSAAKMIKAHAQLKDFTVEQLEERLAKGYRDQLY